MTGLCRACRHFEAGAAAIEAGLPGIAALASTHAASRADDGLCLLHDRYLRGTASCPAFVRRCGAELTLAGGAPTFGEARPTRGAQP